MCTRGVVGDLINRGWNVELALFDIDEDALAVAQKLAQKMIEVKDSPIIVTSSIDRREVLTDATAVISTIGVGGRRAWEKDVLIPRKYGIYQPVGDSVGPGGTSRAMRMIPAMIDIARDVVELAPNALFFNYSNPMSAICRAVRKVTDAKIIGLCHGVFDTGHYLERVLGVPNNELVYSAVGINHLIWFTEISHRARSVMEKMNEIANSVVQRHAAAQTVGEHFRESGTADVAVESTADQSPFSWQLQYAFGAFPAPLDRHVTEFFPQFYREGAYFGKTLGVDAYSFEATISQGDNIFDEMRAAAISDDRLNSDYFKQLSGEHEQVVDIIQSLRNGDGKIYSVNLPNVGQIGNLMMNAVVESPAIAVNGQLKPIVQKNLTSALAGTLATRFEWVETVVEAAIESDREKFIQALILDGAVRSIADAQAMADEFIDEQSQWTSAF